MRYTYEITENNGIKVWDNENPNELNAPFLHQPTWPDGTSWQSKEQSEQWVAVFIESMENPQSEYTPGMSPDEPKILRQLPEANASN